MTHFIFDCDDVLLNWLEGFKDFLPEVGFHPNLEGPYTWDMSEWLGTTKAYTTNLVNQFNRRPEFARLSPCANAKETVWRLKDQGHTCSVLSACGDDRKIIESRYHNLHMKFDKPHRPHAFTSLTCLPLGSSKHQWLVREAKRSTAVIFVEDNFQHAMAGVTAGLKTYCIRKTHNRLDERGNSGSGVIWINDISEVEE